MEAYRGFEYYRDGICQSFMDLIPEPDGADDWAFSGAVESIAMGCGRLNNVVATSHLVLRTRAEIARSPGEYFYLNYKTRGECRIFQSGEEVVLSPGEVGLFDSTKPFALEHRRKPDLAVSSFMLPFDALRQRLPLGLPTKPLLISEKPSLGPLIRETTATLAREADHLDAGQAGRLYEILLDLVALALDFNGRAVVDVQGCRADAMLFAIKGYLRDHYRESSISARSVAVAVGISVRYLHKLFERSGKSYGEYVLEKRLEGACSALLASDKRALSIASIALSYGFSDPAHFHRAFKNKYGHTAGDWRFASSRKS